MYCLLIFEKQGHTIIQIKKTSPLKMLANQIAVKQGQ